MSTALAVDIGGTKLAAALVTSDGRILQQNRALTPATISPDVVFNALVRLIEGLPNVESADVCGVGCGGPMTSELVSPLHIPAWQDFPLRLRLAEATGLATFIENDGKTFALGEGWLGRASGARDFVGVVVSTGVGGGIVLDGRLVHGSSGNAGHIGHLVVEPQGRACECGAFGCLDAEVSGKSIAAVSGQPASMAPLEIRARAGRLVGRALGMVFTLLDLRLAVVGGSVALGFGDPFFMAAREEARSVFRFEVTSRAEIVPSKLGSAAGLLGAARAGWNGLIGIGATSR